MAKVRSRGDIAHARLVEYAARAELVSAQIEREALLFEPVAANRLMLLANGIRKHAVALVGVLAAIQDGRDLPTHDPRQLDWTRR